MANLFIKAAIVVVAEIGTQLLTAPGPSYGPRLLNRAVSVSTYGVPQERCRGTVRCGGNVIWGTKIIETVYKSVHGLFGSSAVYSYQYSVSIAVAFAKGPAQKFLTVWTDGKRMYSIKATGASLSGIVDVDATINNPVLQGSLSVPLITGDNSSVNLIAGTIINFAFLPGQDYEVQADFSLGSNDAGLVSIWPPLRDTLVGPNNGQGPVPYTDSTYNIVIPGLSGNTIDTSDFAVDPNLGHIDAGGPRVQGSGLTFYLGTPTQLPDPIMEAYDGVGNVPGYRDLVYIMIENLQLVNFGNRIPNFSAEIVFDTGAPAYPFIGPVIPAVGSQLVIPGNKSALGMPGAPATNYVLAFVGNTAGGVTVYRINTLSNSVEGTGTIAVGGEYADWFGAAVADNDGFLYTIAPSGLNQWVLTKFDFIAMQVVATLGPGLFGEPSGNLTLLDLLDQSPLFNVTAKLIVWGDYFGTAKVVDRDSMHILGEIPTGGRIAYFCTDLQGRIWVANYDKSNLGSQPAIVACLDGTLHYLPGLLVGTFILTSIDLSVLFTVPLPVYAADIAYDPASNCVITLNEDGSATRIDCATGLVIATTAPGAVGGDAWLGAPSIGTILSSNLTLLSIGSVVEGSDPITTPHNISNYGVANLDTALAQWDPNSNSVWLHQDGTLNIYRIFLDRSSGQGVDVADVIAWLCAQSDLGVSQYDVSRIGGYAYVFGVQFGAEALRDSILMLMKAFIINSAEVDARILWTRPDRPPTFLIDYDELGALETIRKKEPRLIEALQQETDVPERVAITYYDKTKLYQQALQYFKRISAPYSSNLTSFKHVTNTRSELNLTIPVTSDPTTMRRQSQKLLMVAWIERQTRQWKGTTRHVRLDPNDVGLVLYKGNALETRVTQADRGALGALQFGGAAHDVEVYTSSLIATSGTGTGGGGTDGTGGGSGGGTGGTGGGGTGGTGGGGIPRTGGGSGNEAIQTRLLLMDSALLVDGDASTLTGFYDSLANSGGAWPGASLYRSTDGINFDRLGGASMTVTWGTAVNALGNPAIKWTWDAANTLTVAMNNIGQNLVGSTDLDVMNGANMAALIKANGDVELIHWVHSQDNGDGTFTLSRLLRGVRGTEWVTGHAVGDVFVYLDGTQKRTVQALSDIGQRRYYKAVTTGALLSSASTVPLSLQANDLAPYAPCHVNALLDSGSNLIITWERRTRVGGALLDTTSVVPLSEESEAYEVDILNAGETSVLRTITGLTTPTAVYTIAQQTADFGSPPATFHVRVYQLSAVIGRGHGTTAIVPQAWPPPLDPVFQSGPSGATGSGFYVNGA
jgi:hypothetical protein